jgi:hypothetical protein
MKRPLQPMQQRMGQARWSQRQRRLRRKAAAPKDLHRSEQPGPQPEPGAAQPPPRPVRHIGGTGRMALMAALMLAASGPAASGPPERKR